MSPRTTVILGRDACGLVQPDGFDTRWAESGQRETADDVSSSDDRRCSWSADAGVIHLIALGPGARHHLFVGDQSDFGSVAVDVNVLENRRDTDFVMVVDGSERFDWLRTSGP